MEEAFEKLKKGGQNNVDSLVQWMKDSKIIENTKAAEEKARELFNDTVDRQNIELAKFKELLGKIAVEKKKSVEELARSLAAESDRMLNKLKAGAEAFLEALRK